MTCKYDWTDLKDFYNDDNDDVIWKETVSDNTVSNKLILVSWYHNQNQMNYINIQMNEKTNIYIYIYIYVYINFNKISI